MNEHKLFKVNHNAILLDTEGKVLILKQDDTWMLPGGRMEANETPDEALRREVKEETGIEDFKIEKPVLVSISPSGNTYTIIFLCTLDGSPEVKLSNEHQEYTWIKANEVDNFEFSLPKIKEVITKTL